MSDQTHESASGALPLPETPNLEWLRKRAKHRLDELRRSHPEAKLADAQFALAKEYGFPSWRALKSHVDSLTIDGQLFDTARKGDVKQLAALLDEHPDKLHVRNKPYEHTLLHVAAHNGHLQRVPGAMPGLAAFTTAGMHLADRLGDDYLVIGTTTGTGRTLNTGADFYAGTLFTDLPAPEAGSLDALMEASSDGPFATDLRRLAAPDAAAVRRASRQRFGPYYVEVDAAAAYDVIVHLPQVTAGDPDPGAIAASPPEVRAAFRAEPAPAGRPARSAAEA